MGSKRFQVGDRVVDAQHYFGEGTIIECLLTSYGVEFDTHPGIKFHRFVGHLLPIRHERGSLFDNPEN